MRRHTQLELLLELPDGSKRWIPQAWTDAEQDTSTSEGDGVATLGSLADLLAVCALVGELAARGLDGPVSTGRVSTGGDRLHASHRPRRTSMQPVQLSLIPDPHPRPPAVLAGQLPETALAAAIALLAGVIAKAGRPEGIEVAGDE
jgi:hypothetical protein